ncbi:alkylation response protein AidB-like acyl-CoA dehydrogenase [Amycolatopsis bartoniae]|uniref:Acyl-CoA dehydrogenase n=1 Tax=Amycolatopsis bartoniae TaxID=941986 RepID=A0A8H9INP2_9PSEU|nr:acyl-CoA dehydrogenase family protein [Amycolatopsis bartoniae]MBB2940024.1 alkylation response protein AidB-like acyl-CoA dehydrogenase [Amycolatopsis bartoniae]GHF31924.1 acyl-CoA dehydrogenase [Amycolatopsis bartoniae]
MIEISGNDFAREFETAAVELLEAQLARAPIREELEQSGWSESLWTSLVDAGWLDVMLPRNLGGLGLGLQDMAGVFTAVGRYLVPGPVFDNAVAAPLVVSRATRAEHLSNLIAGRTRISLADGAAGGQAAGTRPAVRNGRLFGAVDLVRLGGVVDHLLVVVEDPEPTLVLADVAATGLTLHRRHSFDPYVECASVGFDGAEFEPLFEDCPEDRARAAAGIAELRDAARLLFACETAGNARHMLDRAVLYAKEREQFGRPIGAFQSIQHLLAGLATKQTTLEAACEQGLGSWYSEPSRRYVDAATAKAIAAEVGRAVGEGALQVHGGIAFTREFPLHRWHVHALGLQGLYGDQRAIATELGNLLVGTEFALW